MAIILDGVSNRTAEGDERGPPSSPKGIDDARVRNQLLDEFNIEIAGGLGPLKGKIWRVGLMGYCSQKNNVLLFLAALEKLDKFEGRSADLVASVAESLARAQALAPGGRNPKADAAALVHGREPGARRRAPALVLLV